MKTNTKTTIGSSYKSIVSLTLILATLFAMVILKMEARRMGYTVVKTLKSYRQAEQEHRLKKIAYAKRTNPSRIMKLASVQSHLQSPKSDQIIVLSGRMQQ